MPACWPTANGGMFRLVRFTVPGVMPSGYGATPAGVTICTSCAEKPAMF